MNQHTDRVVRDYDGFRFTMEKSGHDILINIKKGYDIYEKKLPIKF